MLASIPWLAASWSAVRPARPRIPHSSVPEDDNSIVLASMSAHHVQSVHINTPTKCLFDNRSLPRNGSTMDNGVTNLRAKDKTDSAKLHNNDVHPYHGGGTHDISGEHVCPFFSEKC